MNGKFLATVLVSAAFTAGCAHHGKMSHENCGCDVEDAKAKETETSEAIKIADLPAPVLAAFQKTNPDAKIVAVKKEMDAGATHYEIEFTDASGSHEIELNDKGEAAH